MQRRLAAVLAADIVGYSAMMGADEAATLEALRAFRAEIFGPVVAGRRGRIVKSMGDGWLVTFDSAADAVNCAMQVQDRLAGHPSLKLRIGVHVGDVTEESDDIFGDGVNVAARLEGVAAPGGVAISEPAFASLDGTLSPAFDGGGEMALKNIVRPVRVWTRAPASIAARPDSAACGRVRAERGFPQLAVRPVAVSDSRPEVRELAEGLTDDLDAYAGSVRWLVSQVRETPPPGRYDLRTSLRARGDRLRLEARLFAPDGAQLWAAKIDGALADSFDWQDETGEEVASAVGAAILDAETARLGDPEAMTAEQALLMGLMRFRSFAVDRFEEALGWYKTAIDKNPDLMTAYTEAIFLTIAGGTVGLEKKLTPYFAMLDGWVARARPAASGDVALGVSVALADFFRTGAVAPFRRALEDALRRAPFDSHAISCGAWGFLWTGDPEAARAALAKHRRLGRLNPFAIGMAGCEANALAQLGRFEEALARTEAALEISNEYPALHATAAVALAWLGRQAEAEAALAAYRRLAPDRTISTWRAFNDYGGGEGAERYFEGLRRAGLPE